MTAVIAMHPSRFGAIRSLVPFQDFRLCLRTVNPLGTQTNALQRCRVLFQPIDQGELLDAHRLAQVARVYGRSAQFDGDVFDSVMQWLAAGHQDHEVIVNFSALSLEDEAFVPRLIQITDQHHINRNQIFLELDQAVFHPHEEDVKEGLEHLRSAGFHTGLRRAGGMALELCASGLVDYLTIGRRHVGSMLEDPRRRQAVIAMGKFAHTFGVDLMADGVDNYERLGALIESQVTHASGPLFGEDRLVSVTN